MKPWQAERINPFPTTIYFGSGKVVTHGTGKPVPYKGAVQNLSNALTLCEAAMVLHAPSTPGYRNNRIRRCPNAPLKKHERP